MKTFIHAIAGTLALACVLIFWGATVIAELFTSPDTIALVKQFIVYAMAVLVPSMATVAGTGFSLAGARDGRLIDAKKKRMRVIAPNGLLVLLPCAFYLNHKAGAGEFDALFYSVQAVELAAGAVNGSLLILNFRDGLRLGGRIKPRRKS